MAYSGYLIKVGSYTIPYSFIGLDAYTITPDQRQDLDPYRDGNGVLHRNVVPNKPTKIEINTPILTHTQVRTLITNLTSQFTDPQARTCSVEYYDIETDTYKTRTMYVPDIKFQIYHVDTQDFTKSTYQPTAIHFIGY